MSLPSVPEVINGRQYFARRCQRCADVRSAILGDEPTSPIVLICAAPPGNRYIDKGKTIKPPTGTLVNGSNYCFFFRKRKGI